MADDEKVVVIGKRIVGTEEWELCGEIDTSMSQVKFVKALKQAAFHPEYIRRRIFGCLKAEILEDNEEVFRLQRTLFSKLPDVDREVDDEVLFQYSHSIVSFTPKAEETGPLALPFYYPNVRRYAFHLREGKLECLAQFWPSRVFVETLQKICNVTLAMLKKWGETEYEKRVAHDQLVDPHTFYNQYQTMKAKYKYWIEQWDEATDPRKFVFEELGIAAFCICLFKEDERARGRKPSFVDLGCGNGFLVYLLTMEGYEGFGVDIVSRKIWQKYPDNVVLLEEPVSSPLEVTFKTDWLLGNHTDELTPWLPVIAARSSCNFFLLPCCLWDFDKKYSKKLKGLSGYQSYLQYVKEIITVCDYQIEEEPLRIPSTKNCAFVGRARVSEANVEERLSRIEAFIKKRGFQSFVLRRTDRELTRERFAKSAARKAAAEQQEQE